jgi:hypothetical protein
MAATQVVIRSDSSRVILSDCPRVILSDCPRVILSDSPRVILSEAKDLLPPTLQQPCISVSQLGFGSKLC